MSRREGTLKLSSNIEPRASAPLDARLVVPTLADLTASGTFPYPYVGMIVSVQAEGKAYMLTASDPTVSANWTEIGAGGSGQTIQVTELPAPTAALNGTIYQYIGEYDDTTTPVLIRGRFYLCHAGSGTWVWDMISVQDDPRISFLGASNGDKSRVYLYVGTTDSNYIKGHIYAWDSTENAWVDISPWVTECDKIFHGTMAEWDALSAAEKAKYSFIATPDEAVEDIADAVIDGDMRAVTSNAVYDTVNPLKVITKNGFSVAVPAETNTNNSWLVTVHSKEINNNSLGVAIVARNGNTLYVSNIAITTSGTTITIQDDGDNAGQIKTNYTGLNYGNLMSWNFSPMGKFIF